MGVVIFFVGDEGVLWNQILNIVFLDFDFFI